MYTSEEEYLQLLRDKDYIQALELQDFLVIKYGVLASDRDADTLMILLTFSLINSNFKDEDLHHVIILYSLFNETPSILPGEVSHKCMVFINAAMQFHVYQDNKLLEYFQNASINSINEVRTYMTRECKTFSSEDNNKALAEKYTIYDDLIPTCKIEVENAKNNYRKAQEYWQIAREYQQSFEEETDQSFDAAMRRGIVNALTEYLGKTMVHEKFHEKVFGYLDQLCSYKPFSWEEGYIEKLIPATGSSLGRSSFTVFKNTVEVALNPESNGPRCGLF